MSEYVLVNDVHLSDRAPASCTDTYLDDLFDLLGQVATIAERCSNPGGIILAGDVFHHKVPSRTTHATVMRLIQWASQTDVPVYAVAGNHDLAHDRLGSLNETQPLGVVAASGAVTLLDGWMDGAPVYGVPWQMTFDTANVTDALAQYREVNMHPKLLFEPTLVVTHAPLYPPGRELKYEYFPACDWAAAMGHLGTVHYGHVHEPHGIYQVDGVTFSNCGALSRGSLHEHNLTRTPSVAIWDSETGEIAHRQLDAKPATEVFRLQEATEAKNDKLNLTSFLDSVRHTRLEETSISSVMNHIQTTQDDAALVAVIRGLLEQADSQ